MSVESDKVQFIVKLQRLEAQVRNAIDYLKSGAPVFTNDPTPFETPNTFIIGDFVITDKMIEPH